MNTALIRQAITDIQQGKMVILLDDKNRENEGDLVVSAEKITPAQINFMARFGCGLICMPMAASDFDRLDLPMMVHDNQCAHETGFGVSIGAAEGITTGISAADRAHTARVAANPRSTKKDIVKPGHLFPLKAREGGLLKRSGHTEASTDLMTLAGLEPSAVICEIMNDDGTMARIEDLRAFSVKHDITLLRIEDLRQYRLDQEKIVTRFTSAPLPSKYGENTIHVYHSALDDLEWVAITSGDLSYNKNPLVRLHSECLTGDVFGSKRCDCGTQLDTAMEMIGKEGGVLLYLPQEGRGIGLSNKIKAYALQDTGLDTVEANHELGFQADQRDYLVAAKILQDLGLNDIQLLTNNPKKVEALENNHLHVVKRVPLCSEPTVENLNYLKTKQEKLGHLLSMESMA